MLDPDMEISRDPYDSLYVDLLKRVLRNSIYAETPTTTASDVADCARALDSVRATRPFVFEKYNLSGESLATLLAYTKKDRALHTYVRVAGLDNIEHCARTIIEAGVPGDFVDAGTLRGGTAILMRGILKAYGDRGRKVVVADSFEGLPMPSSLDSMFDREIWYALADLLPQYNLRCIESLDRVRQNFERYSLLDEHVVFAPGWFRDTLKELSTTQVAMLRIDADWYEGTRDALEALYPRISNGGFVIIDDYHLDGCKRATDEYRVKNRVFDKILTADADDGVVYWRKGGHK